MWTKVSVGLLLFFVFSFLFKSDASFNQDLGRHVKSGELIVNTLSIPKTNLFSYTYPNFPFVDHHWLFQVMVYLGDKALGLQMMLLFKILILLLSVLLILMLSSFNFSVVTFIVSFLFLHILRERTELRPEIFSFLFTTLTYWILERSVAQPGRLPHKSLWLLPLIQLVWVNTHIYFPLGLMLQGIFLADLVWVRKWRLTKSLAIVFFISLLTALINPNFITGALYPFRVFGNYGYEVVENQTIFLLDKIGFKDPNIFFVKASWVITAISVLGLLIQKRLDIKSSGLIGLGVGLSLTNVRSTPYLIFISLPSIVNSLNAVFLTGIASLFPIPVWKTLRMAVYYLVVGLILAESYLYLSGDYHKLTDSRYQAELTVSEHGKRGMDFVLTNNLPGPIFNNFDIGSYITYRAYPKLRVFVDGRPEAYPASFFQDTYIPSQYDYEKFKKLDGNFKFKTVVFSHTDQTPWGKAFIKNISQDKNWSLVYLDDFIAVYVKDAILQAHQLQLLDLDKLDSSGYQFSNHVSYLSLALFLFNTSHNQKGLEFTQKALQSYSTSPAANTIMAKIYSQSPNFTIQLQAADHINNSRNFIWW